MVAHYGLWWPILRSKQKAQLASDVWWNIISFSQFSCFRMSTVSCPPVLHLNSHVVWSCHPRADTRPDRPIHCVTLHVSLKKHIFQQILSTPKIMVQVCRNINKHHSSHQLVSCEYPTWITCQITARLPLTKLPDSCLIDMASPTNPKRYPPSSGAAKAHNIPWHPSSPCWGLEGAPGNH